LVNKLANDDRQDPNAGYLKEEPVTWVRGHFDSQGHKAKRSVYFVGKKTSRPDGSLVVIACEISTSTVLDPHAD
jgi:hypothetical protein